jgi:peroxiredoxin
MSVDVGTTAPDFTLMDQDRRAVTLSASRGRPVVLAFFPAAYSDTCIQELCAIRDRLATLEDARAQVFGISVDSFFALKAFQRDQRLTFPLLSDFNKEVICEFGVFNEDMIGLKGLAKRAVFVLDTAGVVRYREILEDARDEPDYSRVFAVLATLSAGAPG